MPQSPTHHIPQTLIGLLLWLCWAAGAFAYSAPHPTHEFATVCHLGSTHSYNTTANPNPAKTHYTYNALGQRVFKTDPIFGTPTADNQKLGWAYLYATPYSCAKSASSMTRWLRKDRMGLRISGDTGCVVGDVGALIQCALGPAGHRASA